MKAKNVKTAVIVLLTATFLPYIGLFLYGCCCFVLGFKFFSSTIYGLKGGLMSMLIGGAALTANGVIPVCAAIQLTFLIRRLTRNRMSAKLSRIITAISAVLLLIAAILTVAYTASRLW